MSESVIGIDPSLSGLAVCAYRHDGTHSMFVCQDRLSSGRTVNDRRQRYDHLCDQACGFLLEVFATERHLPRQVFLEGYSYASRGCAILTIAEFGWQLRMRLLDLAFQTEVPPTCLKKFVTGKGTADKPAMAVGTFKRWGVEFKTNDEVDAYGLARMGACVLGWEEPTTDKQREAIASLRGEKPAKKKKAS